MLKRISTFLFFTASLFFNLSTATAANTSSYIHGITSMQEIEQFIDDQTLVLFDLDHTVFEGKNYGYGHANWFYDRVELAKAQGIEESVIITQLYPHWVYSQQNAKVKPVEDLTPALIQKLQQSGVKVLGLTGRQLPLVDITLRQLKEININFNVAKLPAVTLTQKFTGPVMMKEGVIFCSDYNEKGEVLHAYLDKLNIKPKKIIFIDDGLRNLKSVIKSYSAEAVVIGLHYPLVNNIKATKWNAQLAHQDYCDVYHKQPELSAYTLACN